MSALARLSLANRTIVALGALIVIAFGVFAIPQLKQQLIPSIELPSVQIVSVYQGASPAVVEKQVTDPIEDAVQSLDGVEKTTSTTSQGQSAITLEYTFGTDLDKAKTDIQNAIAQSATDLPDDVDPQVASGSTADIPAAVLAATSDLDQSRLATELDDVAVPALSGIPGAKEAQVTGAPVQRVTITLDQKKLKDKGLTADAISSVLTANGVAVPAGSLTEGSKSVSVQTAKTFTSVDDIKSLYVTPGSSGGGSTGGSGGGSGQQPGGGSAGGTGGQPAGGSTSTVQAAPKPVKLSDVATVTLGYAPATTITRTDGKESLGLLVTPTPDGNSVAISKAVRAKLPGLEKQIGHGTKLSVVFDQAPYVERSIKSLSTEGLLGLLFAVIVILIFLLSLRSTLVTAVSIPMSILIALIALWIGDESLNLLTLGALTVAVGRVVDDSIVVLENIKRHLTYGEPKQKAVLDGVREVAGAVTASTLTTVAVFLPIAFVTGTVGELFKPFAIAVTVALLASLFVALTVIPVLSYWFLGYPKAAPRSGDAAELAAYHEKVVAKERRNPLQRVYVPIIRFSTRHRLVTIFLALLILAGTGFGATQLKTSFLDQSGGDTLTVTQAMPVGSSLATTSAAAKKVESVLADDPSVTTYQVTAGGSVYGNTTTTGSAAANYNVALKQGTDSTAVTNRLRADFAKLDGAGTVTIGGGQGGFGDTNLEVVVQSGDAGDLQSAAGKVKDAMASLSGVTDVTSDLSDSAPLIQVSVKREDAAKYGLSDSTIGQVVTSAIQGSKVTQMTVGDEQDDVVLKTDDPPSTLDDLKALKIATAAGEVRLDKVATVTRTDGPVAVSHVDGDRSATISGTPKGSDTGAITTQLNTKLRALDLPSTVTYTVGGVSQDQSDAFRSLGLALAAAIAIVFLILAGTFRSIAQPLILMVSIPFAATGAIGLLLLTNTALGVSALIGLLMLVGIVVTNAIVLMDLMNKYRVAGMSVAEATVEGGRRRLRPVLMTAVATICALTPMALGLTADDSGGFVSQSLAVVVIGGLVSSTLLTLVLVPALYSLVEGRKERRAARKQAKAERRAAHAAGRTPAADVAPATAGAAGAAVGAAGGAAAAGTVASGAVAEGAAPAAPADWRADRVGSALAGTNPTVLRRLDCGFAVIGDTQFLPGYSVLLTDDPRATRLSDLDRPDRMRFLAAADLLAEAVENVCGRRDPAFRRVNVEIQGNQDGFLHAHVWPRYGWEPADHVERPVGRYPDDRWTSEEHALGSGHDDLRAELTAELDRLTGQGGPGGQGGQGAAAAGDAAADPMPEGAPVPAAAVATTSATTPTTTPAGTPDPAGPAGAPTTGDGAGDGAGDRAGDRAGDSVHVADGYVPPAPAPDGSPAAPAEDGDGGVTFADVEQGASVTSDRRPYPSQLADRQDNGQFGWTEEQSAAPAAAPAAAGRPADEETGEEATEETTDETPDEPGDGSGDGRWQPADIAEAVSHRTNGHAEHRAGSHRLDDPRPGEGGADGPADR